MIKLFTAMIIVSLISIAPAKAMSLNSIPDVIGGLPTLEDIQNARANLPHYRANMFTLKVIVGMKTLGSYQRTAIMNCIAKAKTSISFHAASPDSGDQKLAAMAQDELTPIENLMKAPALSTAD